MILRPYQHSCVDAVFKQWEQHQSTLGVLYTGGGKTVIFAEVIRRRGKRAMVLAHRKELIFQARNKIQQVTGLQCEIEMADQCASTDLFHRMPVVVSMIQTLTAGRGIYKRMHRFKPTDFGTLIIDEVHHGIANTYRETIDWFRQNPDLRILGVTATPDRGDGASLSQAFGPTAFNYQILDGIQDGWLCDITQQFVPVSSLDYSHIKTTAGDLNSAELKAVMEAEENIMGICQPSLEVLYGLPPHTLDSVPVPQWGEYLTGLGRKARRAIVFTASVPQAEACCNIFNRVQWGLARWVSGDTNKDERRDTLRSFAAGETRVVMNCDVLTEGFDDPGVEVILMARPTKVRRLYAQLVGRATRPLPGVVDAPNLLTSDMRRAAISASPKPFCRIIDFVGNSGKHKLITCMDILSGTTSSPAVERAIKKAQAEGKPVRVSKALTTAEVEVITEAKNKALEAKRQEEARKAALIAKSKFSHHDIDPFSAVNGPKPATGWRKPKELSKKQKAFLRRSGFNPDTLTFVDAVRKIGERINHFKQKRTTNELGKS